MKYTVLRFKKNAWSSGLQPSFDLIIRPNYARSGHHSCTAACPPWAWPSASLAGAATPSFPVTVEFDLIFPRNETYATMAPMPIIFAIQNPELARTLDLWNNLLLNREGAFRITWHVTSRNCSYHHDNYYIENNILEESSTIANWVDFSIKMGAQQPDLLITGSCNKSRLSDGATYNVTGLLDAPAPVGIAPSRNDNRPSCAVIASVSPSPTADPCWAKVDASAAASISASMTSRICLYPDYQIIVATCPPEKTGAAGRAVQFPVGGAAWLAAAVGVLAYMA
ncbi:hypothetical protein AJ80_07242 [Polytolypa hystricis UAMH7299]|uniref:DUF7136 domain-containing protein n=1 Tax=Polytolypa hystricis (strain UAMH7299) TaxID=1447883 RepID=A0A2B7XQ99_POLH7|nr:hypothetical protein AJ80_07242 [Polytolypa hystricis UAMH7299]